MLSETNKIAFSTEADHPRMRVFSVTWPIWRSYHSICHSRKSHGARKLHDSVFYTEPKLLPIEVSHCVNRDFVPLAAVTLDFTRWPSYMNLTRIPWTCTRRPQMNFLRQGFRKLPITLHTYRQTHKQTDKQTGNCRQMPPKLLPRFAGGNKNRTRSQDCLLI